MAFPVGWKFRAAITIDKTKVGADQNNYPFLICQANCPTDAMDADGGKAALSGGGDLVFTSDISGLTRLSCDVAQFVTDNNPANALVEIYVNVPSVPIATNTIIYMWWGNSSASQPARNASYGMEATWNSSYKAVYHLSEAWGTGAGNFKDATASVKHGTGSTTGSPTITSVAGKWGGKCIRDINVVHHSTFAKIDISGTSPLNYSNRPMTIEFWVYPETTYTDFNGWCCGKGVDGTADWDLRGFSARNDWDQKMVWCKSGGTDYLSTNTVTASAWHQAAAAINSSGSLNMFTDGAANGSGLTTLSNSNGTDTLNLLVGAGDSDARQEPWCGRLDEVRFLNAEKTSTYFSTTYNNHNAPGSFSSFGSTVNVNVNRRGFFNFF